VNFSTDDQFKSSAYLLEELTDPIFSKNEDPSHTAFNKAFQTDLPIFTWFEQPGNESRLRRFGIVFESGNRLYPANAILEGKHCHIVVFLYLINWNSQMYTLFRLRVGILGAGQYCC
jgi:hypothetical protein